MNDFQYFGIDGCSAGWIVISTNKRKRWEVKIHKTIRDFWKNISNPKLIFIDIPIGLKNEGIEGRKCDRLARKILTGKRSSSIFPTPCRAALKAPNYQEANAINRKKTTKGLSKQTWYISKKIKQVDDFLQKNSDLKNIFIESHPELCFTALNHYKHMDHYKKTEKGVKERLNVLKKYFTQAEKFLYENFPKIKTKGAVKDDFLDAFILCISASLGRKNIRFIPRNYPKDGKNLPMRMGFPKKEIS